MTVSVSAQLRIARTNLLVDLAKKNGGKVTPDVLLAAVGGKQKLVLDVLWNARRSGYVNVEQTREGRKIAFWTVTVTGDLPVVVEAVKPAKAAKPVKEKAVKSVKTVKRAKVEKTDEQIKAANLEKMKAVTAKLKKKAAAKKKKKTIVVDDVEQTFGTNGEVGTSFTVDGGWDSMDGINVADLIR